MFWQDVRKMDGLMCSPLRWQHYTTDFLHLWIVRGTNSIQESSNLEKVLQNCFENKKKKVV
jgi:hypothetical protein